MPLSTSFASLCLRSFAAWLLTNILGLALLYLSYAVLLPGATGSATPTSVNLFICFSIGGGLAIAYSAAIWPLLFFLPQLWALSADKPRDRRERLLLAVLAPFAILAASQLAGLAPALLPATVCYGLACLLASSAAYWQWLR